MTRPGTGKVLPNPMGYVQPLDPDTIRAALNLLADRDAMDLAPALGLAPPPTPPPTSSYQCKCGRCGKCRQRQPWRCPDCGRTMLTNSRTGHQRTVHKKAI
jgi:transposase-like protein